MRPVDADALLEAIEKERQYLLARGQTGAEHILVHHCLPLIDNAPTVEPCYQTKSCLDCGNYDKENHNCPRYCEVIKEAINSRPQGFWAEFEGGYRCSNCDDIEAYTPNFCPNCGTCMRKPNCVICDHFGKCEGCKKGEEE